MQKYIQMDFETDLQVILDSKIKWNSLIAIVERLDVYRWRNVSEWTEK